MGATLLPRFTFLSRLLVRPLVAGLIMGLCAIPGAAQTGSEKTKSDPSGSSQISIYHLKPEPRGGRAYKLVYYVPVAIDIYWKFKTDFESDFLASHKYIRAHRLISRNGMTALTENKYANAPDAYFRWKTRLYPYERRLSFALTNPEECGQRFHYGHIQVESQGEKTRITQVAYFDFWGASVWAQYPWGGGMRDFLIYTAKWEEATVLRLKGRYSSNKAD